MVSCSLPQEVVCYGYDNSFAAMTLAQCRPGPEAQRPIGRPRANRRARKSGTPSSLTGKPTQVAGGLGGTVAALDLRGLRPPRSQAEPGNEVGGLLRVDLRAEQPSGLGPHPAGGYSFFLHPIWENACNCRLQIVDCRFKGTHGIQLGRSNQRRRKLVSSSAFRRIT